MNTLEFYLISSSYICVLEFTYFKLYTKKLLWNFCTDFFCFPLSELLQIIYGAFLPVPIDDFLLDQMKSETQNVS
jgi:hypothetical protein